MEIRGFMQREPEIILDVEMINKIKEKIIKGVNKGHRRKLQSLRSSNTKITNSLQRVKNEIQEMQQLCDQYDTEAEQYLSTVGKVS